MTMPSSGVLRLRALRAIVSPCSDERTELLLGAGRGRSHGARIPSPADELVLCHVMNHLGERFAAISLLVLDLFADFAERAADPGHLDRRQHPLWIARHALEVRLAVAGKAAHAGGAHAASAPLDRRLVDAHRLALPGMVVGRMAIQATRRHDHFARFLEERDAALLLVGDLVERRYLREAALLGIGGTGKQNCD